MLTDTLEPKTPSRRPASVDLSSFAELVRSRRSIRHFRPDPVPAELLLQLIDVTRWSPSGFNLQPTHWVIAQEPETKARLFAACMKQRQVLEAGATIVFTGDRQVVRHHFEQVLRQDREAGAINADYEHLLRTSVPLLFNRGPWGIGWLWKALAEWFLSPFVPIPSVQAVHMDYWLAKQVSLSAMTLMLAAEAAGLATCPMEGFSERAVQRALGIPSHHAVVLIVAVGYADNPPSRKTRRPLDAHIHHEQWKQAAQGKRRESVTNQA